MPTGYTAFIEDGKVNNGKDFIKLCSRAFGAYIIERDKGLDEAITKEFQLDPYYKNSLIEAEKELAKLKSMTIENAETVCNNEYNERIKNAEEGLKKQNEINQRYFKVLREVKKWLPPTKEHIELKKFAINQIEMCINNSDYWERVLKTPKQDATQWLKEQIELAEGSVIRAEESLIDEETRIADRNRWIKELHESLV